MQSPRCQQENPLGQKFCGECGAQLASVCPSCGESNAPDQKFCGECGTGLRLANGPAKYGTPHSYTPKHLAEKILTSKAALEGERKQVTVLFVDVSGFTALSEKLDPEDVHELMDRAFELMLGEVHRYEGSVNQFLGDGLMALFGAPVAHEDHSVRAVHAALGIQRALGVYRDELRGRRGIEFRVRMGLNSGGVVVGKIGDNLRMDYTAVGDTTNLAARLLGVAEPGQVLVSEDIVKAVEPYFVLRPLDEVGLKGKTLAVRPYLVEGIRSVRSRLEAESERGLTPLVGREHEMALLRDGFAEAQAAHGQAVFVYGEAGIGKSRLLLEFRHHTETSGARWILGRCVSYGHAIAHLPVLDFLRDLFGIKEGDDVETMQEKLANGVRGAGDDVAWTIPFLRALFSLDPGDAAVEAMIPIQRKGRTAEAVRDLFLAHARKDPLVPALARHAPGAAKRLKSAKARARDRKAAAKRAAHELRRDPHGKRPLPREHGPACGPGDPPSAGPGPSPTSRNDAGSWSGSSGRVAWQNTHAGEREVKVALCKTLFKYKLHQDQELFDRAYGYIRVYY